MGHMDTFPLGTTGVISDIHGNPTALRSVVAEGATLGVERWMVLGDVVATGPDPVGVLEMLDDLDVVVTINGNTERYTLTMDRPDPSFETVMADPSELPRLVEVAATFAWTRGFLAAHGRVDTILSYVSEFRSILPDGSRLLALHASLVSDAGPGITPRLTRADVEVLFPSHGADVVMAGHTHERTDIQLEGARFVNPGSVSNHHGADQPATFSILHVERNAHCISHHDVDYPKAEAVEAIRSSGIPGQDFLIGHYFPNFA